jgi:hypothetical protein
MGNAFKNHEGFWVVAETIKMSSYDLEGSVESIKAALDEVYDRAIAKGMVNEGTVNISARRGFYSDDYEIEVEYNFTRAETKQELDTRLANEAKLKDAAAAKRKAAAQKRKLRNDPEYAEFERLRAKFGG